MKLTRNTFEKLATLDKYDVCFEKHFDRFEVVEIETFTPSGYWVIHSFWIDNVNTIIESVEYLGRYTQKRRRTDKSKKIGQAFIKRITKDLQKANLI